MSDLVSAVPSSLFPQASSKNLAYAFAGAVLAKTLVWPIASFVRLHLLHRSALPRYARTDGDGAWAVVTGASSGIGFALSNELAAAGFNVVLHGRNAAKLDGRVAELQKQHPGRKFRTFVLDAAQREGMAERISAFAAELEQAGIKLTLLVNGAGAALLPVWAPMLEQLPEAMPFAMDLMVNFPVILTGKLLPLLIQNEPSAVVNMGTAGEPFGLPFATPYLTAKAAQRHWSRVLGLELKDAGHRIEVLTVVLGVTQTPAIGMPPKSFEVVSATVQARAILSKLGCGQHSITPVPRQAAMFGIVAFIGGLIGDSFFVNAGKGVPKEYKEGKWGGPGKKKE